MSVAASTEKGLNHKSLSLPAIGLCLSAFLLPQARASDGGGAFTPEPASSPAAGAVVNPAEFAKQIKIPNLNTYDRSAENIQYAIRLTGHETPAQSIQPSLKQEATVAALTTVAVMGVAKAFGTQAYILFIKSIIKRAWNESMEFVGIKDKPAPVVEKIRFEIQKVHSKGDKLLSEKIPLTIGNPAKIFIDQKLRDKFALAVYNCTEETPFPVLHLPRGEKEGNVPGLRAINNYVEDAVESIFHEGARAYGIGLPVMKRDFKIISYCRTSKNPDDPKIVRVMAVSEEDFNKVKKADLNEAVIACPAILIMTKAAKEEQRHMTNSARTELFNTITLMEKSA